VAHFLAIYLYKNYINPPKKFTHHLKYIKKHKNKRKKMKQIIAITTLLVALTSTAWAEPTNQPRPEDQRVVLRTESQRMAPVVEPQLRLFDYQGPQGSEKLFTHPKPEAMITWQ
jgi:hypothetical protein